MRGERNIEIDWHDADMRCDGGAPNLANPV
jgi:hypothetical protein